MVDKRMPRRERGKRGLVLGDVLFHCGQLWGELSNERIQSSQGRWGCRKLVFLRVVAANVVHQLYDGCREFTAARRATRICAFGTAKDNTRFLKRVGILKAWIICGNEVRWCGMARGGQGEHQHKRERG